MSAQLVVIIAGVVLALAIVGSVLFLRGYSGPFTFDTKNGTRPRAAQGQGNTAEVSMKGRLQLLTAGVGAALAALAVKLWTMQMVSSDYYEGLSEQNRTRTVTTPAPRGRILDRDGNELVTNRASLNLAAYRDLANDEILVRHLANLLGVPYIAVVRSIQDYSQSAQSLHTIQTDVRRSTVAYIQEHPAQFEGVQVVESTQRSYPNGSLACHVLGYTGTINSEQLAAQQERQEKGEATAGDIAYESGDIVGQAGAESQFEELLQGIRGEQTVRVDSAGTVIGQAGYVPGKAGSDIKLTISTKIQKACEEGLAKGIENSKKSGYKAVAGACVCIDPTNGEILGMASYPTYDPSVFIGGISNDDWDKLNGDDSGTPMLNRALGGAYMTASTIKPFSTLAALEYGIYSTDQSSTCTGWWTGLGESAGRWCWNHSGHGSQNLRQAIINSCDTVFYDVGKGFYYDEKNPEGLQEMFRRWGLGSTTGIDLPGETAGRIPDAAWKKDYFKDWGDADREWQPGDMLNIVIGQGDILVTPLQLACAYAGLAMKGTEYTPHVFLSAVSRDGEGDAVTYGKKERLTAKLNSSEELDYVRDAVARMIYEEDASIAQVFADIPGTIAGKTGTGEKTGEDDYGWFATYGPVEDPKYVVVAMVEQGGFGSTCAIPAVRHVWGQLYDVGDVDSYGSDQSR